MKVKSIVIISSCLALLVYLSPPLLAQMAKINVSYSSISADLPAWLAKKVGIVERDGLDVQLIYFAGGTTAVMPLVSGDIPSSQMAGSAVINSVLAGSDAVMVAAGTTSLDHRLMGRPDEKIQSSLRRHQPLRLGPSDFIARYALGKMGLTPGKDVTIGQIASTPARMDATLVARVQATFLNPPTSFISLKRGIASLADLPKLGLTYQHTGVTSTRRFTKEHPGIVKRVVKSQVDAVHRIWTDKETSVKFLSIFWSRGAARDTGENLGRASQRSDAFQKKSTLLLKGLRQF